MPGPGPATPADLRLAREAMVRDQIAARGVRDPRVLEAMRTVPRHRFLDPGQAALAHADRPLPIGLGQTLSQPYIVAVMAEALGLDGSERVLEVGSGSGYMAAVLSHLASAVYGVELEPELHRRALENLAGQERANLRLKCGDGALGWPEQAPFDAVVLSCAAGAIPAGPWAQLRPGGRMILPLGAPDRAQELVLARKTARGVDLQALMAVGFVPLRVPPGA